MELISIVIPIYNAETTLTDCLDSIIAQSHRNWEAICIDDGSTDRSMAILQKYQKNDSRFKVFHQSNNGVSSARNNALQHLSQESEWVHFVDSDDFIAPTMYQDILDAIHKQNDPSIDYVRLFGQKTDKHYSGIAFSKITNPQESALYTQDEYFLSNKIGGFICNLFVKKEIAVRHKFDEAVHIMEDQPYSIACALDSKKILFFHKPNYFYYQNPNSSSHRFNRDKSNDIIRVVNNIISLDRGGYLTII